ncbi:Rab11-interacting protein [Plakobranchus ocellatus]|uniref:Rab11-interacting protein n=1 Tax=Plakobranchus ocellatus TaxID=259542 RepID=A0AAV4BPA1_9GAST|nr:Rab11-interacting protein [Plakobranchus ocellatus]
MLLAVVLSGNNDVFATIQLGREKYQTSTIKNALNPEWFEECDLTIPHMHSVVEVTLYHRGLLSDDFLGYAAVPIWEQKVADTPRSSWVSLHSKPSKSGDSKYRGELEVKLTFHCQSKTDFGPSGLKKRTPSIRNLASVFGDKFRFTRSRSFRENRRDPEGGKVDRVQGQPGAVEDDTPEAVKGRLKPSLSRALPMAPIPTTISAPHPRAPVHFSALDIGHSPWEVSRDGSDGLTRSYSMSAAYIKSMSLERGPRVFNSSTASTNSATTNIPVVNSTGASSMGGKTNGNTSASTSNIDTNINISKITSTNSFDNVGAADADPLAMLKNINGSLDWTDSAAPPVSQVYSQSVHNLPGERRSCAELPPHHIPTLPLPLSSCVRSQDDSALSALSRDYSTKQPQPTRGQRGRTMSDIQIGSLSHREVTNSNAHYNSGDAPLAFLRPPPPPPSSVPGQTWREHFYSGVGGGAIYESIKERTEPENSLSSSSSSTSDGESVPMPKSSRVKRGQKKHPHNVPIMGRDDLLLQQRHHQQQIQQLYRQPCRRPNNANPEQPGLDPSPTKSGAIPWGGHATPPQLPLTRPAPRPNSYPNAAMSFCSSPSLDSSQQNSEQLQALSVRDSGILDDRSSSQGNSLEGSGITTPDCASITSGVAPTTITTASRGFVGQGKSNTVHSHCVENPVVMRSRTPDPNMSSLVGPGSISSTYPTKPGSGGILYHLDRELAFTNGSQHTKHGGMVGDYQTEPGLQAGLTTLPGHWPRRENSQGDFIVRKRSRGERDRLRQARQATSQGNRRHTVQSLESCLPGAYSDSQSEANASPRQEISKGLLAAYSNMNKEELLRVVIQAKAQMIRKDQYIRDLETYIDDLLVRVMETTPRLLTRPNMLRL